MTNVFLLFIILFALMIGNSIMVKISANKISWQENVAYSRIPIMFYDLYMIIKYVRLGMNKYHWISLLSGLLVVGSLPITYKLLKMVNLSVYTPLTSIAIAFIVLCSWIFLGETIKPTQLVGIGLAVISVILIGVGQ